MNGSQSDDKLSSPVCKSCKDLKWVILQPINLATNCPHCSVDKNIEQIQVERAVRIVRNNFGCLTEVLLQ